MPPCLTLLFPSGFWVSAALDSGASCTPAWALPGNRAAAVQLGPCAGTRGTRSRLAPTPSRLRPCDLTPPAVPRLRHGESTICCQALPQLPAASPRASVERRVSGRGPGPGAGTTSRPRAPPPSRTASSPINLTLIPLCQLCMPGPGLQQFCVSVLCGSVAEKPFHPLCCEPIDLSLQA